MEVAAAARALLPPDRCTGVLFIGLCPGGWPVNNRPLANAASRSPGGHLAACSRSRRSAVLAICVAILRKIGAWKGNSPYQ